MSFLIFSYRHQDIIARKSALNFKLLQLNKKLMDLQTYAANIADGSVSMNDLMTVPPSLFNRMSVFMQYSHQSAMMGAQQKLPFMMQAGVMPQVQDPMMQRQYQQMLFKNLYDQEREKASKVEEKILHQQELKIEQEKASIETQLKALDAEEEKVKSAEDEGAKKSAPQYVA